MNETTIRDFIQREIETRLSERCDGADTPNEAARDFLTLDRVRIEAKAFGLFDASEDLISDLVYEECEYRRIREFANDLMQHGPAPRPRVGVVAGEVVDDIPF